MNNDKLKGRKMLPQWVRDDSIEDGDELRALIHKIAMDVQTACIQKLLDMQKSSRICDNSAVDEDYGG